VRPESAEAMIEIARSAFVTLDADGRVLEWNRRATEMFGYPREVALGSDLAELIVPERYRKRHRAGLRRARSAAGGNSPRLMVEAVRRDGSELPVEVSIAVVGDGDEGGRVLFHAWIEDVSERTQLLRELEAQLRRREPGFGEILDALAEAVTIRDPHHHILYANRAAFESMGFASLEEMQRRPPQSIFSDYIVQGEHGEDLTMDAVPSVRLLAGEPAEPLVMRTINRSTGELRWQLLKAAPLHDEDGRPVAAVTIIEDITRERTAELRDRFLARATETLMSSLDYEETLRNVAWLAVPEVADWCAVELVDERGTRQRVAVAHRDPAKLELAERLRGFEPEELDPNRGVGRILRTGASELYQDIPDEALAMAAINDEHLTLLRSLGFRSVMLVPLRARGRTFGVMTLVTAESMRRFAEADLEFAEQVAGRAAVAVDNALLATARRHTVETLQRSLLPDVVPELDGWNVATFYRAAHAIEEIEVGGDFFDFYETDDAWIVLLGDVTGKGVEAAALTSLVRHGARFLSKYERSPSRILVQLNEALSEQRGLLLCTAVCVRLERGQAVIASAGHPAPLIVRDDGRVREVGTPGPILGAWTGKAPADRPVLVAADETLLLYTDGVLDTLGERERFGAERLRRLLVAHAGGTPDELLSELEAGLDRFQALRRRRQAPPTIPLVQADDIAALALRPEPVTGGPQERAKHLAGASRTLPVT